MLARGLQMEKEQQELMNHERSTSVRIELMIIILIETPQGKGAERLILNNI